MSATHASAACSVELPDGVWRSQTPLWQTNSLVIGDHDSLVIDPAWTAGEIHAIVARCGELGGRCSILLTHADYDHVCGVGAFAGDVEVIAGTGTADRIADGGADSALARASREWGLSWEGRPRVDRVLTSGEEIECAGFAVRAIDARGHTADGLAYVFPDLRLLVPGDYLSSITFPFVTGSVAETVATHERLLAELEEGVDFVVPGHGPAHDGETATAIARADLAYLQELASVARQTLADGMSQGDALLATYAVRPPRPNTDDFEVYGLRAHNCRAALAERSRETP